MSVHLVDFMVVSSCPVMCLNYTCSLKFMKEDISSSSFWIFFKAENTLKYLIYDIFTRYVNVAGLNARSFLPLSRKVINLPPLRLILHTALHPWLKETKGKVVLPTGIIKWWWFKVLGIEGVKWPRLVGIPGNFAKGRARPRTINLVLSGNDNDGGEKWRRTWITVWKYILRIYKYKKRAEHEKKRETTQKIEDRQPGPKKKKEGNELVNFKILDSWKCIYPEKGRHALEI